MKKLFELLKRKKVRKKFNQFSFLILIYPKNSELIQLFMRFPSTLAIWWARSTTLLEYPHSLSYQETTFKNFGES